MNLPHISNKNLTLLRKLNQKKYRQREQFFLAEGARAVAQISTNQQLEIKQLFFDESQQYWQDDRWTKIIRELPASLVDKNDFAEVSDTDHPQGVLALCKMPRESEAEVMASKKGLMVALDAIRDPGNMGAIIRSAAWFGVAGLLCGKGTVDLFHPKVVRATAGATGTAPHANVELAEALPIFEAKGWQTVLLDAGEDAKRLRDISKKQKIIIVIGNEAHGIDASLKHHKRKKLMISSPRRRHQVESLNAAIAASIALYELSWK